MLVSIITPTYNHEKYIAKCIESVISQEYKIWEMIIVDDGSTDNTSKIVIEYTKKYPQIKYYYQENKGLIKLRETYNFALGISKGELIAILEGDDYWYSNKLAVQTTIFKSASNIVFSWSRVDLVQENETKFNSYPVHYNKTKLPFYNNTTHASILNIFLEDFPVPLSWVLRKSTLLEIGGFCQSENMPTVDMDTLYNISLKGRFHYFDETLGAYRRSMFQATRKLTIEISKGSCEITKSFYQNLPSDTKKNIRFTFEELETKCAKYMIIAYSKFGRSCLVRKEFKEARNSYILSLTTGGFKAPIWKLRSFIGLIFSFFKIDLEFLSFKTSNSYK